MDYENIKWLDHHEMEDANMQRYIYLWVCVCVIGVELCVGDVDFSKSITKPFDPLIIVVDPYNSRKIK